jgi:putative nucleotidyltransferase with HDIG domain
VDDERIVRDLFRIAFERSGYKVTAVDNGLDALAEVRRRPPDLIVMDVHLPKLDCIEATRRLRSDPATAKIPVIALTAAGNARTHEAMTAAGASCVFGKSAIDVEELLATMDRLTAEATPPAIDAAKIRLRLRHAMDVRPVPVVAAEIVQLAASDDTSAGQLTGTLERDPALTGRVLRLANSAFYALHGRVQSLSQAVTRIGFRGVRGLALAVSLVDDLKGQGVLDRVGFWKHSLACAVLARELARRRGSLPEQTEISFLAGLLHDVGKPLLEEHAPDEFGLAAAEARRRGTPLCDVERELLGLDHAAAAAELARRWNLPGSLTDAIVQHHAPWTEARTPLVSLVKVADILARALRIGSSGNPTIEEVPDAAAEALGLNAALVEEACGRVDAEVRELTEILLLHGSGAAPHATPEPELHGPHELLWTDERHPKIDAVGLFLRRTVAGVPREVRVVRPEGRERPAALAAEAEGGRPTVVLVPERPSEEIRRALKASGGRALTLPVSASKLLKAISGKTTDTRRAQA